MSAVIASPLQADEPATPDVAPDLATSVETTGKAKPANDHRWARRKRVDMAAMILSDRLSHAVRCLVFDTSSSGARIGLTADMHMAIEDIPDQFTLVVTRYRERSEVQCAVMRRDEGTIGVRFLGCFNTVALPPQPKVVRRPSR